MAVKTKIVGLDELVKALDEFGGFAMPVLQKRSTQAADVVLQRARQKVPQKSRALHNSLLVKEKPLERGKYRVLAYVTWGDDVREYAAPLELGHNVRFGKDAPVVGYAQPRPFLRPAADESKKDIKRAVIDAVNEALVEIGGLKPK